MRGEIEMKKLLLINGMSCKHCVHHVTEALEELGAKNIIVSLEKKSAEFEASDNITDEEIKAAIEDAGYDVVKASSNA
jgi:copper chaperone